MRKIVLGSTSPFRRSLLEKLHIPFDCDKPNIDESPLENESPRALVERLAIEKAKKVAERHKDALIIGSDQVAICDDVILGKPHTRENAIKQLMSFSGKRVTFLTGLCVLDSNSNQTKSLVEPFYVDFKRLTEKEVATYVDIEEPLNCAGSFKSEGLGISLFEKLSGDDPNSLIGLPLIKLISLLRQLDYDVFSHMSK